MHVIIQIKKEQVLRKIQVQEQLYKHTVVCLLDKLKPLFQIFATEKSPVSNSFISVSFKKIYGKNNTNIAVLKPL